MNVVSVVKFKIKDGFEEAFIEALKAYGSEMMKWPHARSLKGVEHLAHWRGASVGFEAAEAFMLARNLK